MTSSYESWRWKDPALVYERIEARNQRQERAAQRLNNLFKEPAMTRDESLEVEELLMTWYHWCQSHREFLGASRVAPGFSHMESNETYDDGEETDAKIDRFNAEQVNLCFDILPVSQKAAIGVHTANKAAGADVFRNPRMTAAESHAIYQQAKEDLLPLLRKRGIIKSAQKLVANA
jgi:hypothetical protein